MPRTASHGRTTRRHTVPSQPCSVPPAGSVPTVAPVEHRTTRSRHTTTCRWHTGVPACQTTTCHCAAAATRHVAPVPEPNDRRRANDVPASRWSSRRNDNPMVRITMDVPDDDHAQKIVEMIRDLQGIPASVAPDGEVIVYPVTLVEIDRRRRRSEEHTSELRSRENLVC